MKKLLLALFFGSKVLYASCPGIASIPDDLEGYYNKLWGSCGDGLKEMLYQVVKGQHDLGYTDAREFMYSELDNDNGTVCSVYSEQCVKTWGIPDHTVMNCEHSWPQSLGAVGDAKSDLHHLFPVMARMNSRRGNYPFCEVEEVTYQEDGSALGYSAVGTRCFEPRDEHKGDVARAMLYFSIRYNKRIDSEQESFFRVWNIEDPVSEKEILRNNAIYGVQHNRNPFIDNPEFIDYIEDF